MTNVVHDVNQLPLIDRGFCESNRETDRPNHIGKTLLILELENNRGPGRRRHRERIVCAREHVRLCKLPLSLSLFLPTYLGDRCMYNFTRARTHTHIESSRYMDMHTYR